MCAQVGSLGPLACPQSSTEVRKYASKRFPTKRLSVARFLTKRSTLSEDYESGRYSLPKSTLSTEVTPAPAAATGSSEGKKEQKLLLEE